MPIDPTPMPQPPLTIRMNDSDNVVIVANDGGLAVATVLDNSQVQVDRVPQGHTAVVRDGIAFGHASADIAAGGWVPERLSTMAVARSLQGLPIATRRARQSGIRRRQIASRR